MDRTGRTADRLFETALRAFPKGFRERHADGLRAAFQQRHRTVTSRVARFRSVGLTLADTVISGLAERASDMRRSLHTMLRGGEMRSWLNEVRIIMRGLRRSPVFTAQVLLTVTLGTIGVGAVYPVLQQVVLRPLPYHEPDRLATVRTSLDEQLLGVTPPEMLLLSRQTDLIQGIAAVLPPQYDQSFAWTETAPSEPLRAIRATPEFMSVLGVDVNGPDFDPSLRAGDQVILSHGFWQSRFGGDASAIGRTISLNNRPHAVVGILPEPFEFPLSSDPYDVWVVQRIDPAMPASVDNRILRAVMRLEDGVGVETLQARLPDMLRTFHEREATGIQIKRVEVRSLHADLVGSVRTPLLFLTGAAVLVLVIAALNVALLISARNLARERELAVRRAIGAGRGRVARFLLTEAGLLAVMGTVAGAITSGFVLAWVGSGSGLALVRSGSSSGGGVTLATAPALAAVFVVALLAALVPALRASRAGVLTNRSSDSSRGVRRAVTWVIGVESALVFGLLVAAGITLVSLNTLTRVDPGFDPGGRVAVEIQIPVQQYPAPERGQFFQRAEEHLAALAGVTAVGSVTHLPLDRNNWGGAFAIEGRTDPSPDALPEIDWEFASPGYFQAAGIPVLEGRSFTAADRHDAPLVAIMNETLARRYWPNGSAVGARVNGNGFDGTWFTVVGVVGDVKQQGLEHDSRGYLYMSSGQTGWTERQMVVRTESANALATVPDIRRALLELEPALTIGSVTAFDELVHDASGAFRLRAALFGIFGLIAALLGMAGIYGVVSHGVQARKHEVGIRLAVGADAGGIFRMVIVDGLRPVILGILGGVALVVATGRWLSAFVFGIEPGSPVVMAATATLLIGAAIGAIVPPALRARRLDPMPVLQSE